MSRLPDDRYYAERAVEHAQQGDQQARAMKAFAYALLLVTALSACGGSPTRRATPSRPPTISLIGQNLILAPGAARAARIGFAPFGGATDIIVTFTPSNGRMTVCPLRAPDEALPPVSACRRDIGSGVRETIGSPGMRAIALVVESARELRANLTLEYDDGGRSVSLALPSIHAPQGVTSCGDNACNPFFELRPTRKGRFSATARWEGPAGTLELLQGSVLGRSFTATGVPYLRATDANGASPLSVRTQMTAPGEYALALRQTAGPSAGAMQNVFIDARWP